MWEFTIKPFDVVFFGDGKPFNLGGMGESIFPPFPNSFASAIFSKIYKQMNTNEDVYKAVYGPFLKKDNKYYFPAPCDIAKEKTGDRIKVYKATEGSKLIKIENTNFEGNLKGIPWIKPESQEEYEPFRGFISLDGLKSWYEESPIEKSELLTEGEVFDIEDRVSISMDDKKGTVKEEDGLYKVRFVRLKEGFSFVFWVEFKEQNYENVFKKFPNVLKIGGETRTAVYEVREHNFKDLFKDFKSDDEGEIFKILFLTPGVLGDGNSIFEFFENLEYACISGYTLLSIRSRRYKNRFVRAIKPGSVFSIRSDNNLSIPIDFYKRSNDFIGSNLVLVKKGR
ncbi:MAG: type III-B CRISPR module-associated protein Cmr3 [Aquificaceae bacterium]